MWCLGFVLLVVFSMNGLDKPTTMKDLTFLTRDGCVSTPDMVNTLDDAEGAGMAEGLPIHRHWEAAR